MKRTFIPISFALLSLMLMSCRLFNMFQTVDVHSQQEFRVIRDTPFYYGWGTNHQGDIAKDELVCLKFSSETDLQHNKFGTIYVRTSFKISYTGGIIPGWVYFHDLEPTGRDCEAFDWEAEFATAIAE